MFQHYGFKNIENKIAFVSTIREILVSCGGNLLKCNVPPLMASKKQSTFRHFSQVGVTFGVILGHTDSIRPLRFFNSTRYSAVEIVKLVAILRTVLQNTWKKANFVSFLMVGLSKNLSWAKVFTGQNVETFYVFW